MQRFQVKSPVASVTVTTLDGTVKKITFGAKTKREPETRFEKKVAKELGEYFAGKRQEFTVPIELTGTEFQLNVWNALAKIPYGETKSYGEIAKSVKCPGGARAVGMANHNNPIPIIIPCHRVVAAGGKLGGFGGGLALKRRLLALEETHSPAVVGG